MTDQAPAAGALAAPALTVACLCAAWCRTCDGYAAVFQQALAAWPGVQSRWVDIEDEADLLGDFDVETFPTLVISQGAQVFFAGPLTPQPATLQRVLRAALEAAGAGRPAPAQPPEVLALALRLRATPAAPAAASAAGAAPPAGHSL